MERPVTLHTARWVLPIKGKPIENGAVAVFEGFIADIGPSSRLRMRFPGYREVAHENAILMPALVNAHCHLELSPLRWRLTPTPSFTLWVDSLVKARENVAPAEWVPAIEGAVNELITGGVYLLGDVGSSGLVPSMMMDSPFEWPLEGIHFLEIIQPEEDMDPGPILSDELFPQEGLPMNLAFSAHAVYTVTGSILREIKRKNRRENRPFSIHVAESPEEMEYLLSGGGPMLRLFEGRGRTLSRLSFPKKDPVEYLLELGLLDEKTLLVHCVQCTPKDLAIIKKMGASVCLCPRSNTFLGVGSPPVAKIFELGINCAIGTDSLASNDRLDLFSEMAAISRLAPELHPRRILEAATLGGARALGFEYQYGTLEPGKRAIFLSLAPKFPIQKEGQVEEGLVGAGSRDAFEIDLVEG